MFTFTEASLYYYRTRIGITPDDHFINGYEFPDFDEDMGNEEFAKWLQGVCDAIGAKAGYSPTVGICFPQKPEKADVKYIAEHSIDLSLDGKYPNKIFTTPEEVFIVSDGWSVTYRRKS